MFALLLYKINTNKMNSRTIVARLTDEEVKRVDEATKIDRRTRCSFIAFATLKYAEELLNEDGTA